MLRFFAVPILFAQKPYTLYESSRCILGCTLEKVHIYNIKYICSEGTEISGYVMHVDFVHLEKFDKKLQDMSSVDVKR